MIKTCIDIKLCQHMYPLLAAFEIALRNHMAKKIKEVHGVHDWRDFFERGESLDIFISRQTFDYWVKIIKKDKKTFGFDIGNFKGLQSIRTLRNRAYHYESIIKDIKLFDDNYNFLEKLIIMVGNEEYKNLIYKENGSTYGLMKKIRNIHIDG
jgi:hypothetical protein